MLGPCNLQSGVVKQHNQPFLSVIWSKIHFIGFDPLLLISWSIGVFELHDLPEIKAIILTAALIIKPLFGLHLKRVE